MLLRRQGRRQLLETDVSEGPVPHKHGLYKCAQWEGKHLPVFLLSRLAGAIPTVLGQLTGIIDSWP